MEQQFTADCHYVPKFYIKNWSNDSKTVHVYRTVVKSKSDPLWSLNSIKSLPVIRNLYTSESYGVEYDDLEKWFNIEIEKPASVVLRKVTIGEHLSKSDYNILIRFLAAQIVRTPKFFLQHLERIKRELPSILNDTIQNMNKLLSFKSIDTSSLIHENNNINTDQLPIRAHFITDTQHPYLQIEALPGRKMWQYEIKWLMEHTEKVLHQHRWDIIKSAPNVNWATSDDPVICLNYKDEHHYDFNGGWGRKNGNIIFPLSPHHLMFTEIGNKPSTSKLNNNTYFSSLMQKMIIEHAYLYVFAKEEIKMMYHFHPRKIDMGTYEKEIGAWKQWGELQHTLEKKWGEEARRS